MGIAERTYHRFLLLFMTGCLAAPLQAQTPFDPQLSEAASRIGEQVQVFTDRNIYAVDEHIYFSADHRVSGLSDNQAWSSVLYLELVAPNGETLVRGKYGITGGMAEGSIHIPSESKTGNYILKCYTRWMRNAGPGTYSYTPLKIINPFRSEVGGIENTPTSSMPVKRISYRREILECKPVSTTYQAGQEVLLQLRGASGARLDQLRCCITVVREGAVDLDHGQLENMPDNDNQEFRVDVLPDLGNNISISGTVVGPDLEPVPHAKLHFSLLGEDPDYFAALSDAGGRFVIKTPLGEGEYKEFFVTPEQDNGSGLEVRIDQEYDSRPTGFALESFRLTAEERELARKIALNMQLTKVFKPEEPLTQEPVKELYSNHSGIPFYGTDVQRLFIDDYVMLPNLEEVLINLIPEAQVYRKQGSKRIRILSENNSIGVFKPLIMIDHISVFDHEALLALSPEKIERIDLINDIYLKGSVPFGGVLAIYSRKGDMAGIDLPRGSYFFDYQAFHPDFPPVDPFPVLEERVPDTRNTLLWSADVPLQEGQQQEIHLRAPSGKGKYVVLVRAVAPGGEVFAASSDFSVE